MPLSIFLGRSESQPETSTQITMSPSHALMRSPNFRRRPSFILKTRMIRTASSKLCGLSTVSQDTTGAQFVPGLNTTAFDAVIFKGTHAHIESYSAFKDIWGKDTTELPGLIEAAGVTDVFIVGLAGDYCVKYTAIDSLEFGYRTWLITDGIKSIASKMRCTRNCRAKASVLPVCKT